MQRIPVHGGTGSLGVRNKTVPVWNAESSGYGGRCPVARTLLTYSQSSNPRSPQLRVVRVRG
ncbi:hypothetical protein KK483_00260 [Streptomyces sp. FIT100]|nr:hypothetical protein [Streptomyces sp. FIT100]UUN31613.1 hypothetical protein KK483_00260 [Streptomyces sp. FIT100]